MRLLYLLVDEVSPSPGRVDRRLRQGQAIMPPGWDFDVRSISIGPPHYEENVLGHALAVPGIIHSILAYQHECDAVLIGCFGDPGLAAARAMAEVPVVGPAEASFVLVRLTARRFGLVAMGESDIPTLETYLSADSSGARCVGVETLDMPIAEVLEDIPRTAARLVLVGERLRDRGAEAIILGCMSFGFHPFADELGARLGIGVIDPLRASIAALLAVKTLHVRFGPVPPAIERPKELMDFLARLAGATSDA
jgi:allantoin racemase